MEERIREQLKQMSEEKYRKFSDGLIPGDTNLLGVRIPKLRDMAKQIVKEDYEEYLACESVYFEEKMLKGLIIGYATEKDKDAKRAFRYLDAFIDAVDNWSVCDSMCNSLKVIRKDLEYSWEHIQKYLESGEEFKVRVGLILILNHFIKCDSEGKRISRKRKIDIEDINLKSDRLDENSKGKFEDRIVERLNRKQEEGYYAMMAAAWTTAEMFVTYPKATYHMLLHSKMDDTTHNKAIQKICESLIPSTEVKEKIRGLKR